MKLVWLVLALPLMLLIEPRLPKADLFKVTEVFDGDTIEVDMARRAETIRFIGVNTPETHHPEIGAQCYGAEATKFTTNQIGAGKVRLVADAKGTNRDRYERLLRYVYLEDGKLLNLELVRKGYGFASRGFRYSLSSLFNSAELQASSQGLGLWSKCQISADGGYLGTQQLP